VPVPGSRSFRQSGRRPVRIIGGVGTVGIAVSRARIGTTGGGEGKSMVLPRYDRMTEQVKDSNGRFSDR
jgi:hypothetical protein